MGRADKLFEAKDVALGIIWYALGIGALFALALFLSWVVRL